MNYIITYQNNNIEEEFIIEDELKYSIRKQENGNFRIILYFVTEDFIKIKNSQLNHLHDLLNKENISNIHIYQTINNKNIEIFAFEEELIYKGLQLGLEVVPATDQNNEYKMELRLFIG